MKFTSTCSCIDSSALVKMNDISLHEFTFLPIDISYDDSKVCICRRQSLVCWVFNAFYSGCEMRLSKNGDKNKVIEWIAWGGGVVGLMFLCHVRGKEGWTLVFKDWLKGSRGWFSISEEKK